jgi:hypothetical protein
MIEFPAHKCGLYLTHNEYRDYYLTVEQWEADYLMDDDDWVSPEERAKAIATGDVWELQWYPDTPIGFFRRVGSTLESVLGPARDL